MSRTTMVGVTLGILCTSFAFAGSIEKKPLLHHGLGIAITGFYLQPGTDNLNYAIRVKGQQPTEQSWFYEAIDPDYTGAFELGLNYTSSNINKNFALNWMHINTTDSASAQANPDAVGVNIEFVGPQYDIGPAVFASKRALSTVKFYFDDVSLNAERPFTFGTHFNAHFIYGVKFLRFKKTMTTTFNQNAGSAGNALAHAVAANPNWYVTTENISKFLGAGTDAGLAIDYKLNSSFSFVGQATGTIAAGQQKSRDNFNGTGNIPAGAFAGNTTSNQFISEPNIVRIIPGLDAKLGFLYTYTRHNGSSFSMEAGYRLAAYLNAFTDVSPQTLVQSGLDLTLPEFVTGTLAINSTTTQTSMFNFNGVYFKLSYHQ